MMNANQLKNLATVMEALPALVAQGLRCFPCRADKTPATPRGYKDASSMRETVEELWRRFPGPLIGIPTGEMSGFDVLDIDPQHGGAKWFAEHKSLLPPTRVHQTR